MELSAIVRKEGGGEGTQDRSQEEKREGREKIMMTPTDRDRGQKRLFSSVCVCAFSDDVLSVG